ncbi:OmpA family protein [Actinomadura hibisca]|uniref:OmpA family protein n=1 Tax=Actinomadura hibisca TaxID=68565 RepID=UPI00082B8809|nr:OmpA family protein [Actinomadura hibisca]
MSRIALWAALLALLAAATGCTLPAETKRDAGTGGITAAPPGRDTRAVLASAPMYHRPWVRLDLVGLNRFDERHLVVQIRVANTARPDQRDAGTSLDAFKDTSTETTDPAFATGISVLDAPRRRMLLPYRTPGKGALATDLRKEPFRYLKDGAEATLYAVLPAPPPGTATTTVVTQLAPPFANVPISGSPPTAPPGQPIPNPDRHRVQTVIAPLNAATQTPDGGETQDDGTDLRVHLSTDVLFAVNASALTPRARQTLHRAATQIDASTAPTVQVEGHTDSSGDDTVNDPLSQRRADAVKAEMEKLVTRAGVRLDAKGYGSKRPLYPNTSTEGKRRNRRVTLTFQRPVPKERTPPPPDTNAPTPTVTSTIKGQPLTASVQSLRSLGNGLGVLTYRITNKGTKPVSAGLSEMYGEWMEFTEHFDRAVAVLDPTGQTAYLPVDYRAQRGGADRMCVCTSNAGVFLGNDNPPPGQSRDFWAVVSLPPDNTPTTSVQIARFPRLTKIPITR